MHNVILTFWSWHRDNVTVVSSRRELLSRPCPKLSPSSNKKLQKGWGTATKNRSFYNARLELGKNRKFLHQSVSSLKLALRSILYWLCTAWNLLSRECTITLNYSNSFCCKKAHFRFSITLVCTQRKSNEIWD